LGELLDEGYLTKERLEWAVKWAYNSKLQQAARVILDSLNQDTSASVMPQGQELTTKETSAEIEIPVSLEKAWSTAWPFLPYKGQMMGVLAESRQLSLKDLGYAIENAWDEKVRQAAIALALIRLNQVVKEPAPSAGFVYVVSGGRSFAQRRETLLTLFQGLLFGFGLSLALYFLFSAFRGAGKSNPHVVSLPEFIARPNGFLSLVIAIAMVILLGWLFNRAFERVNKNIEDQIDSYRLGQEGEDNVAQLIVQALDGNWHLFRNVVIPSRNRADLDLVLVGPPGIWVLEVKNFHGEYRNIGETWERRNGKSWKPAKVNPSRQATNNALRLKNFLKADNVNAFVNSAVIWANSEGTLTVENPTVTVWQYSRLADELGNIWQGEKISGIERDKILEKLTKSCEQQKRTA
jgi:hypothetical protein